MLFSFVICVLSCQQPWPDVPHVCADEFHAHFVWKKLRKYVYFCVRHKWIIHVTFPGMKSSVEIIIIFRIKSLINNFDDEVDDRMRSCSVHQILKEYIKKT